MKDICDELDKILIGEFITDGIKFAGLSQLVLKDNQPHPVSVQDNKQIAINDKWDVLCYHRLNGTAAYEESEEQDFGRSTGRKIIQPMKTVIAHKVKKGEEWIYSFLEGWPESLDVEDGGGLDLYEFVDVIDIQLDTNQEEIYNTEFGGGDYEKHRIPWNIYAVEYNVQFKRC